MRYLPQILCCLLLTTSPVAYGWGQHAHSVIAGITEHYLDADTKTAVAALLEKETLAQASNWPDRMRGSAEDPDFWSYDYAANWHFINIPPGLGYGQSPANSRGDIYTALLSFTAILRDEAVPDNAIRQGMLEYTGQQLYSQVSKTTSLKFVLHLIADLHQPLHVGYPHDRGGNTIRLDWPGSPDNLHALWDRQLSNIERLSVEEHLEQLATHFAELSVQARQAQSPLEWMNEALVLRQEVYRLPQTATARKAYLEHYSTVAEQRMVLAGIRTAAWLNSIFDTGDNE